MATTVPTSTVSPSGILISAITPESGEGISVSTLSVLISKIISSLFTLSPTFLCHFMIVPSFTLSPIFGIMISILFAPFFKTLINLLYRYKHLLCLEELPVQELVHTEYDCLLPQFFLQVHPKIGNKYLRPWQLFQRQIRR